MKKQINIRLGDYLIEQIDIIGHVLGMTRSEIARQAIVEFVTDFDKKRVKKG